MCLAVFSLWESTCMYCVYLNCEHTGFCVKVFMHHIDIFHSFIQDHISSYIFSFHALKIKYPEIRNFQSGFNVFRGGGGGWGGHGGGGGGGGVALLKHSLDFALFNNAHLQHNFDNLELARTFLFGRKSPPPPPQKKKTKEEEERLMQRCQNEYWEQHTHTNIYICIHMHKFQKTEASL